MRIFTNNPSECSSQEEILEANCSVSTKELSDIEWSIRPNVITPGSQIRIESEFVLQDAIIELRNANGQLILSSKLRNSLVEIPTNTSSGLFFLSIIIKGKVNTKKLIVH